MTAPTPREAALFDAGATWATATTDRPGYDDALCQAVAAPGDDRGRELAEALALADELIDGYLRDRRPCGVPTFWRRITETMRDDYRARLDRIRALAAPTSPETRKCPECGATVEVLDPIPSLAPVLDDHRRLGVLCAGSGETVERAVPASSAADSVPRAHFDALEEWADQQGRERDRFADVVRRVEHKLGLHLRPGANDPSDEISARRVEKWLDSDPTSSAVTREAVIEAVREESKRPAVINAHDSDAATRLLAMLVADRLGLTAKEDQ